MHLQVKKLNLGILVYSSSKSSPRGSIINLQAEENYSFPSGSVLSKMCFPQQKRGERNYDLLYRNSVRINHDELEH